ncbi:MAG: DUF218 domain-containing protein [Kiritimatiellales bacterium]|nr:DUF218 domain-containing protein [Kiritimatiellales bacterium]
MSLTKVKPVRRPTWRGWLLIAMLLAGLLLVLFMNIYSFLAPEEPPYEGVMVVEGWIHDFALDEAAAMYRNGNYSHIACTGIPIEIGSYLIEFESLAHMTALRLRKLGIPKDDIIVAVADEQKKDRTYLSAVALREAFIGHNIQASKIHLVTTGPHGRRSRLLFQKALGKEYQVGITCLPDAGYEPEKWYAYSRGVRSVIEELIAYLYAKLFFHP